MVFKISAGNIFLMKRFAKPQPPDSTTNVICATQYLVVYQNACANAGTHRKKNSITATKGVPSPGFSQYITGTVTINFNDYTFICYAILQFIQQRVIFPARNIWRPYFPAF